MSGQAAAALAADGLEDVNSDIHASEAYRRAMVKVSREGRSSELRGADLTLRPLSTAVWLRARRWRGENQGYFGSATNTGILRFVRSWYWA